jgi:hypothetical protein
VVALTVAGSGLIGTTSAFADGPHGGQPKQALIGAGAGAAGGTAYTGSVQIGAGSNFAAGTSHRVIMANTEGD